MAEESAKPTGSEEEKTESTAQSAEQDESAVISQRLARIRGRKPQDWSKIREKKAKDDAPPPPPRPKRRKKKPAEPQKGLSERLVDGLAERLAEDEDSLGRPQDRGPDAIDKLRTSVDETVEDSKRKVDNFLVRALDAYMAYYEDFKNGVRFTEYGTKNIFGMAISMFIDFFDVSSDRPRSVRAVRFLGIGSLVFAVLTLVLVGLINQGGGIPDYAQLFSDPFEVAARPTPSLGIDGFLLVGKDVGNFQRNSQAQIDPRETFFYTAMEETDDALKEGFSLEFETLNANVYELVEQPTGDDGMVNPIPPGRVTLVAGKLGSAYEAVVAMRVLRNYVGANRGTIGNFAIGMTQNSYMYYTISGIRSYAWTRGEWMFTVSADSLARVRAFVETFPY